jgi:hypothetical protein
MPERSKPFWRPTALPAWLKLLKSFRAIHATCCLNYQHQKQSFQLEFVGIPDGCVAANLCLLPLFFDFCHPRPSSNAHMRMFRLLLTNDVFPGRLQAPSPQYLGSLQMSSSPPCSPSSVMSCRAARSRGVELRRLPASQLLRARRRRS